MVNSEKVKSELEILDERLEIEEGFLLIEDDELEMMNSELRKVSF